MERPRESDNRMFVPWELDGGDRPLSRSASGTHGRVVQPHRFLTLAVAAAFGVGGCRGDSPPRWSNPPLTDGSTIGSANAPVVAVYYTDYTCPRCRDFAVGVLAEVERRLVSTGR